MSGRTADYDYEVPPEAVAQVPAAQREDARLLVVGRGTCEPGGAAQDPSRADAARAAGGATLRDGTIRDLPGALRPGDLLVLNAARVLPGRLSAVRAATGGRVSLLVLRAEGRGARVLVGARGALRAGETLEVDGDAWRLAEPLGEGRWRVEVARGRDVPALLADAGRMPLPPYIERAEGEDPRDALDRERYQTTYSAGAAPTAAAAPTAGLHLTPELLAAIAARGVAIERLRLDVGEGTFRPLRGETLDEHVMHAERYEIPASLADRFAALRSAARRAARGRVVAVGTTVVRALESAVSEDGRTLRAGPGETSLFLRPGHRFRAVDALLTNFHQPRSTLLVLVSAFAGAETIRRVYAHALASGYRLFSYGDAMLIE